MIVLNIYFDFPKEMMGDQLVKNATELALSINNEPGFISKIWTENKQTGQCGGIYIFQDQQSAENYLEMHLKRLRLMGIENPIYQFFDVNIPLTEINHGIN